MKMRLQITAAASALILGAAVAQAADVSNGAVQARQDAAIGGNAYNWSGGYVGAQLGYVAGGNVNHLYQERSEPWFDYDLTPDGAFGGLFAGYSHQYSNGIVLGAEGDLALGNVGVAGEVVGGGGYDGTTDIDWTGSVRLRAGYAIDRFMPYVTGGVAFGRFSFEEHSEDLGFRQSAKVDLTGWTIGAGADYALTDNWILRGEYRFVDFNEEDFVGLDGGNEVDAFTARIRTHDFRIGAAYRF